MLSIHFAEYEALRTHGEETYPHECCGVLLGKNIAVKGNEVHEIVRAGKRKARSH